MFSLPCWPTTSSDVSHKRQICTTLSPLCCHWHLTQSLQRNLSLHTTYVLALVIALPSHWNPPTASCSLMENTTSFLGRPLLVPWPSHHVDAAAFSFHLLPAATPSLIFLVGLKMTSKHLITYFPSLYFPVLSHFLEAMCHPKSTHLREQLRNSCRGGNAAARRCWQRKKKRGRAAEHLPRQKHCRETLS